MSVLFCDDFKGYGTNTAFLLDGLYAEVGNSATLQEDPDPNASGTVFRSVANSVNGFRLRRVFAGTRTTVGFGCRLWMSQLPPNNTTIPCFSILDDTSSALVSLTVDTVGKLVFKTGYGNGTIQETSAGPVLTANAWNHIEFKAPTGSTTGVYIGKVNGVTVFTSDAININVPAAQIVLANPYDSSDTCEWFIKDWVVWDTLGGDNDDFMGTVQVIGRDLLGDVSFNWTPSVGTTGFNLLNNSPPQDTVDYISAAFPAPAASTFSLSPLSDDITSVRALITQVRARKIDGGDGNLQNSLISGGDTSTGSDRPITSSFTYYEDIFEVDPHTAAAWTPVSADAATLKIDRTV